MRRRGPRPQPEASLSLCRVSQWPHALDPSESTLLNHYIQRFSRTYPTFSGPTNPFLQVVVPLALQSRTVLDALLALGGVQSWQNGSFMLERPMLTMRQKALKGCQVLAQQVASDTSGSTMLHLLTSCVLLILYEKLAGEQDEDGAAHLRFFANALPRQLFAQMMDTDTSFQFVANLFMYNDLVRFTSFDTMPFSDFYLHGDQSGRAVFPRLIARLAAGDLGVTDGDFQAWDGNLAWLPSFSLSEMPADTSSRVPVANATFTLDARYAQLDAVLHTANWSEHHVVSELYRVCGSVYRRQRTQSDAGNLPVWGVQLLNLVPEGSSFENTLLWPIGIIAKELSTRTEQHGILARVRALETRFQMKHFWRAREYLESSWAHVPTRKALFG